MISFTQPWWIPAGLISCVLLWLLWRRQDRGRRRQLARFAAPALLDQLTSSVCEVRRTSKKLLVLAAVFCCFIALSRPQHGYRWLDVRHKGIDILIALDTSRSMLVEDIRPNRLERSKLAIMDFVGRLQGDRVGLLPFAGSAHLLCPLTADYQAFEQSLLTVDTAIIPGGGTDIGGAIKDAETILTNEANHKILVIITDGEDLQENGIEAARTAHSRGMTIFTIGVGTVAGNLIPDLRTGGFIKDETDSYVLSRLDRETLVQIGAVGGGFYGELGRQGEGLETVYREKLAQIPKTELTEQRKKVPVSRSEWPLALAIALLCGDYLLSGRKSSTSLPQALARFARFRRIKAALLLPLVTALVALTSAGLQASEGERAYAAGDYSAAAVFYRQRLAKDPGNPVLHYNSGTAAYKSKRFDEAVESFDRALATADPALQEKAYFNKGNALYRAGEAVLPADPQRAIRLWEQALTAFAGALTLAPDNLDAAGNRTIVSRKSEHVQQQQTSPEAQPAPDQEPSEPTDTSANDPANGTAGETTTPEQPAPQKQDDRDDSTESGSAAATQSPGPTQQSMPADREQRAEGTATAGRGSDRLRDEPVSPGHTVAMTREEARRLLQAIEGEEGRLDLLLPQRNQGQPENRKDW